MKILLSWLNDFINTQKYDITTLTESLTNIGLEVDSYVCKESIRGSLQGLIVGEVVSCAKHPNADRLSCVKVDVGNGNILDIVCGAPNVKEGIKCVVALPGVYIHTINGEDILIKETKIRGCFSEGMLCAGDEIGINNDHEGIIELEPTAQPGEEVDKYFNVQKDYIIDIELTPNRAYALSHLGVARDLKAILKEKIVEDNSSYNCSSNKHKTIFEPKVEILNNSKKDLCDCYCCAVIKNVTIKESPDWIKERLQAIGLKPKNNVVDITNYIMYTYGQPMHVYDYNKIKGYITIRQANAGEVFKALNSQEYKLNDDIVICDEEKILSLAGIIGGESSCVDNETVDILFESAEFDCSQIRRSSQKLKLRTDASYRFERGIDSEMHLFCLQKAIELLSQEQNDIEIVGWGEVGGHKKKEKIIKTSLQYIDDKIGMHIDKKKIEEILHLLDIEIQYVGEEMICSIPSYRLNIQYPSDIVDEILRMNGFNNINIENYTVPAVINNDFLSKNKNRESIESIINFLVNNKFHEIITSPLLPSEEVDGEDKVMIVNPAGINNTLRTEMISSGLKIVRDNINAGNNFLNLFEKGKVYFSKEGYKEEDHLILFMTGEDKYDWQQKKNKASFFEIKSIVLSILNLLHIINFKEMIDTEESIATITKNNLNIIRYGLVDKDKQRHWGIQQEVFYADININNILNIVKENENNLFFKPLNRFPITHRELCFVINKSVSYEEIKKSITHTQEKNSIVGMRLLDVYVDENKIGKDMKAYSLDFSFQAKDHTLCEEEINNNTNKIITLMNKEFNAQLRTA